ncbi:hypothetical protein AGMMS49975_27670 [Clostridia bacterium]|nr:hypothetical protein AGMMS49975_27670 [Clostridia bacterium]
MNLRRTPTDSVTMRGIEIQLDLAFDRVLTWLELLDDDEFSSEEKLDISLNLLLADDTVISDFSIYDKSKLLEEIEKEHICQKSKRRGKSSPPTFDYVQDADLIFASFYMDYGIDLLEEIGKLHWAKFTALFAGLSERTKMFKVMEIRGREIPPPDKYNAKEIRDLKEQKLYWKLEVKDAKDNFQDGINEMAKAFANMR